MNENIIYAGAPTRRSYRDESGVVRCSVCGEPVYGQKNGTGPMLRIPCSCDRLEKEQEVRERAVKTAREKLASSGLHERYYGAWTFSEDMEPESDASAMLRRFVACWEDMKASGCGLVIEGAIGSGKSFYSACVANALREQGVCAITVRAERLAKALMEAKGMAGLIDKLNNDFELIVLDDLETINTPEGMSLLERFINLRAFAGLPFIVTTTLTAKTMEDEKDGARKRVFDRVNEHCPLRVILPGESKRRALAEERARRGAEILGI